LATRQWPTVFSLARHTDQAVTRASPCSVPGTRSASGCCAFGAVAGVIFGLSLGVPGIIEAFTGETAVISFIVGSALPLRAGVLRCWQAGQLRPARRAAGVEAVAAIHERCAEPIQCRALPALAQQS
jgi:hypothetical protein